MLPSGKKLEGTMEMSTHSLDIKIRLKKGTFCHISMFQKLINWFNWMELPVFQVNCKERRGVG